MFEARRARKQLSAFAELTSATPDGARARATGVVKILERELRAPATGTPCVAFVVHVIEPKISDGSSFEPNQPFDCIELVPFALECDAGRVIVDSHFAEMILVAQPPAKRMHDVHWTDFVDARKLSPTSTGLERLVKPGDTISVGGTLARRTAVPGAEAGFRESPTQLCLIGDFDHPLVIYQQP